MINLSSLHPIPISNSDTLNSILALGVRIAMQDKPPPHLLHFASYCAGVMQDKATLLFEAIF
jgi:hypothetical protein